MKYVWIARQRSVWPTRAMCRLLRVSLSGFLRMIRPSAKHAFAGKRPPHAIGPEKLRVERQDLWQPTHLARPACSERAPWHKSRCPIDAASRIAGSTAATSHAQQFRGAVTHGIAPNHLHRRFEADAPNQKWVADVTYIWTAEGGLFVAAAIDLYSHRIIGRSMSNAMHAKMVTDVLLMALWRRGRPAELIHHSDPGSQYTSEDFQSPLRHEDIT